ncbi:hypothetical protein R3P38DRAFT_3210660 [Favolaschia claudopus]|uniref:Uncharacterized protein n=1 Tax=Favolaschia claudopus TaxID=2862362 RepID=A0AAW0AHS9_9AGAR
MWLWFTQSARLSTTPAAPLEGTSYSMFISSATGPTESRVPSSIPSPNLPVANAEDGDGRPSSESSSPTSTPRVPAVISHGAASASHSDATLLPKSILRTRTSRNLSRKSSKTNSKRKRYAALFIMLRPVLKHACLRSLSVHFDETVAEDETIAEVTMQTRSSARLNTSKPAISASKNEPNEEPLPAHSSPFDNPIKITVHGIGEAVWYCADDKKLKQPPPPPAHCSIKAGSLFVMNDGPETRAWLTSTMYRSVSSMLSPYTRRRTHPSLSKGHGYPQYVRFVNEKGLESKAKQQPEVPTNFISSRSVDEGDMVASVFNVLFWNGSYFCRKEQELFLRNSSALDRCRELLTFEYAQLRNAVTRSRANSSTPLTSNSRNELAVQIGAGRWVLPCSSSCSWSRWKSSPEQKKAKSWMVSTLSQRYLIVVGPMEAVVEALLSLVGSRVDVFDVFVFVFSEDYWSNLTSNPHSPPMRLYNTVSPTNARAGSRPPSCWYIHLCIRPPRAYKQLLAALDDAEVARSLTDNFPSDDELPKDISRRSW